VKWWLFALRFVVAAAIALTLLGLLMKPYAHVLRWIVVGGLNGIAGFGVTQSAVVGNWFRTSLDFAVRGSAKTMPAGFIAINLTAFVALVGATPDLGWRRTVRSIAIGCAIFLAWHAIQISVLLVAGVAVNLRAPTGAARFLATISVVLPFAVWVFLTKPPFIFDYFGGEQGDDNAGQT